MKQRNKDAQNNQAVAATSWKAALHCHRSYVTAFGGRFTNKARLATGSRIGAPVPGIGAATKPGKAGDRRRVPDLRDRLRRFQLDRK